MVAQPPLSAKELFLEVVELPVRDRVVVLDRYDDETRHEVQRLLQADQRYPESELPVLASPPYPVPQLVLGARVGRYLVQSVTAHGGMGTVYEAEQQNPRRIVALKILHPFLGTSEALVRFRREAAFLAHLDHPNIARVYEADEDDASGLAYLSLELINDASTITEFCSRSNLPVEDRIELFRSVCSAVAYAHQKGVLHRDLKPNNILVDGQGRPRVIDFGIARAFDTDLATQLHTSGQGLLGTLRYMAPELFDSGSAIPDVQADVYALGVVLYEILSGEYPYDLGDANAFELPKIIRDDHRIPLARWGPSLSGDLASIVDQALATDPNRRYATVTDLSRDLERYLAGEPIEGRRQFALVAIRKTLRRYRATAVVAAFFLILAISSIAALGTLYRRSESSRIEAEVNLYLGQIALSQRVYEAFDGLALETSLERASLALRDWEWTYLKARSDDSIWTHRSDGRLFTTVATSTDGERLIAGAGDGVVSVISIRSGQVIRDLSTGNRGVRGLALSNNDKWLAIAGEDGNVTLWDAKTYDHVRSLPHPRKVYPVAFSSTGRKLFSGCYDGHLRIWNPDSGELLRDVPAHMDRLSAIAICETRNLIATAGIARVDLSGRDVACFTIRFWTLDGDPVPPDIELSATDRGEGLPAIPAHGGWVSGLEFARDGAVLFSGSEDGYVKMWTVDTRSLRHYERLSDGVSGLALSRDERRLAIATPLSLEIRRLADGYPERSFRGHTKGWLSPRFLPDGVTLASASSDGTIKVWDTRRQGGLAQLGDFPSVVKQLASTADGRFAAAGDHSGAIGIWNLETHEPSAPIYAAHRGQVRSLAFDGTSSVLLSLGVDRVLRTWTLEGEAIRSVGPIEFDAQRVDWDPLTRRFLSLGPDGALVTWDIENGRNEPVNGLKDIKCATFDLSADGSTLVTLDRDDILQTWHWPTQALLGRAETQPADLVAISHDGSRICAGARMGQLRLWNQEAQLLDERQGHARYVTGVSFAANGSRLLTSDFSPKSTIWTTDSLTPVLTLTDPSNATVTAFSSDGRRVLTGGRNGEVWIRSGVEN